MIDATGAPPKKDFTVVVRDGRIASVTPRAERVPETEPGARVIDATGKYLIPGLWDMHVHITAPEIVFPLLLANGITGVREMYSGFSLATIRQWKQLPDAPRMYAPGFIDGPLMSGEVAGCRRGGERGTGEARGAVLAGGGRGLPEGL